MTKLKLTIDIETFESLYQLFSVGFGTFTEEPHKISDGMIFLNTILENGKQELFLKNLSAKEYTTKELFEKLTALDSLSNLAQEIEIQLPKCLLKSKI